MIKKYKQQRILKYLPLILSKKDPNKLLKKYPRILSVLKSFGTKIDNKIWISSDKEVMHVNSAEYNILKRYYKKGIQQEAEELVRFIGIGLPTKIGFRYEPVTATLIALAVIEGLKMGTAAGRKTAAAKAQKKIVKGQMKKVENTQKDLSVAGTKDVENLWNNYSMGIGGMTQSVGKGMDDLSANLKNIEKAGKGLTSGTGEIMKDQAIDDFNEMFEGEQEKMLYQTNQQMLDYTKQMEHSRNEMVKQLGDLQRQLKKLRKQDEFHENIF
tara:strand:+ start:1669 stop:2478 length:810 start_codon:yes stop_codon:yes gene_type:complete